MMFAITLGPAHKLRLHAALEYIKALYPESETLSVGTRIFTMGFSFEGEGRPETPRTGRPEPLTTMRPN